MIVTFVDLLTAAATLITATAIVNRTVDKIAGGFVTKKEFTDLKKKVEHIEDTCDSILYELTK